MVATPAQPVRWLFAKRRTGALAGPGANVRTTRLCRRSERLVFAPRQAGHSEDSNPLVASRRAQTPQGFRINPCSGKTLNSQQGPESGVRRRISPELRGILGPADLDLGVSRDARYTMAIEHICQPIEICPHVINRDDSWRWQFHGSSLKSNATTAPSYFSGIPAFSGLGKTNWPPCNSIARFA